MGEEQQSYRTRRDAADVMFTLRQLVGMRWEEQDNLGFIDLNKASSTVPRKMAMTALMWKWVGGNDGGRHV